jgi:alpha-L-fucosidase
VHAEEVGWPAVLAAMPLAEWWWSSSQLQGSAVQAYAAENPALHGGGYERFVADIRGASHDVDPSAWVAAARTAGAGYVVITAKHHDGFLLWPSRYANPHRPGWHLDRDLLGHLADACRAAGLRFGTYYSGGLDWTFGGLGAASLEALRAAIPRDPLYAALARDHWNDLVERYRPDILWNDVAHVAGVDDAHALFARYYDVVPDGVVNDRFGAHADVLTPPRHLVAGARSGRPFEVAIPMGTSSAWNRAEGEEHLLSARDLVHILVDVASRGGNLLLAVGPTAHGSIPRPQRERLEAIGAWIAVNGDALRGNEPWAEPILQTASGTPVRALLAHGALHLALLGRVGREVSFPGYALPPGHDVRLLGSPHPLPWRSAGRDLVVQLPDLTGAVVPVIRISPAPTLH